MVADAIDVFRDTTLNGHRIEELTGADPLGREHLAERLGERTAEPIAERHAKPLLAPRKNFRRQSVRERALQESLQPAEPAELELRRDAAGELHECMIQKGRAKLEPDRHARAVGVGEVLAGEIEFTVTMNQPRGWIGLGASGQRGIDVAVRVKPDERRARVTGEKPRVAVRWETTEERLIPRLRSILERAEKLLERL